ncbi:helix-turn-helix transcriptional regulator [Erysipelothrix anatis]|uniref:helix-turn-helix transcriptional regulator n=1 Tax=Erysipelothrix anatis TaxID=2683713 RepID=UPI001358C8E3|nr:helix-turn-helix transcriptional regulator [Erysipelothrix anatis]
MELASQLRRYREREEISQYTLAKKIGVSNSTILRLENGEMDNPSLRILISLSNEMNITLDELVFGSKEKTKD